MFNSFYVIEIEYTSQATLVRMVTLLDTDNQGLIIVGALLIINHLKLWQMVNGIGVARHIATINTRIEGICVLRLSVSE